MRVEFLNFPIRGNENVKGQEKLKIMPYWRYNANAAFFFKFKIMTRNSLFVSSERIFIRCHDDFEFCFY